MGKKKIDADTKIGKNEKVEITPETFDFLYKVPGHLQVTLSNMNSLNATTIGNLDPSVQEMFFKLDSEIIKNTRRLNELAVQNGKLKLNTHNNLHNRISDSLIDLKEIQDGMIMLKAQLKEEKFDFESNNRFVAEFGRTMDSIEMGHKDKVLVDGDIHNYFVDKMFAKIQNLRMISEEVEVFFKSITPKLWIEENAQNAVFFDSAMDLYTLIMELQKRSFELVNYVNGCYETVNGTSFLAQTQNQPINASDENADEVEKLIAQLKKTSRLENKPKK